MTAGEQTLALFVSVVAVLIVASVVGFTCSTPIREEGAESGDR